MRNEMGSASTSPAPAPVLAPIPTFVSRCPLPPDLENEPFSTCDTGVRSEINHINPPRAVFHCYAFEQCGDICLGYRVDYRKYNLPRGMSREYKSRETRWKSSTCISVFDVYDNYGLDVTRSYIARLVSSDVAKCQPDWIAIYLVGSLEIANPDLAIDLQRAIGTQTMTAPDVINKARSALLSHMTRSHTVLSHMTRSHTVLSHTASSPVIPPISLVPSSIALPTELLVRIINSVRVSKEIAKHVIQLRLARELLSGEMQACVMHPYTEKLGGPSLQLRPDSKPSFVE